MVNIPSLITIAGLIAIGPASDTQTIPLSRRTAR
jgi:hypothetical protein